MSDNARIDIRGKSVDLPIVEGSEGELGLDISKLRAQSKTITLDPGYVKQVRAPVRSLFWMVKREFCVIGVTP